MIQKSFDVETYDAFRSEGRPHTCFLCLILKVSRNHQGVQYTTKALIAEQA